MKASAEWNRARPRFVPLVQTPMSNGLTWNLPSAAVLPRVILIQWFPQMGLTGLQFINVVNGCATGGSALISAYNTIKSGAFDIGLAIGFDKHERGAFRVNTGKSGERDWYGGSGMALTTQFFGMKINRYMEEYGITQDALARVSAKAFRNGSLNENAWRRQALSEKEVLQSAMLSYPLTQYMFCSPRRRWRCIDPCQS